MTQIVLLDVRSAVSMLKIEWVRGCFQNLKRRLLINHYMIGLNK